MKRCNTNIASFDKITREKFIPVKINKNKQILFYIYLPMI